MTRYRKTLIVLFVLFAVVNGLYLQRVPGLMGDEASEGENVYDLLHRDGLTIQGERSYIGPLIDYVRVPFIKTFGYTALAVRVPTFLASLATFLVAASVFKRWWGEERSLFPLVAMSFSLPYLTHQRLGWAITLLPFFFFLTVWLAQRKGNYKWAFVGFAAGLGLHTHIMFAPTLAALMVAGPVGIFILRRRQKLFTKEAASGSLRASGMSIAAGFRKSVSELLLLFIGFWAAFGTQFVVLQLFREDQGDPHAVAEVFTDRLNALPQVLPLLISGSSYVAAYTGVEFAPWAITAVTGVVSILALLGVILAWRSTYVWLWLVGLAVHIIVLLYMIDRFSLRYFVMFVLGLYVLAGLGVGEMVVRFGQRFWSYPRLVPLKATGLTVVLAGFWVAFVLVPFLRAGGSVASFSLGNRTDSASALVDTRPLLHCLRGVGPARGGVSSENVHIYNRLLYWSRQYPDLKVISDEKARRAEYIVNYRLSKEEAKEASAELCPELTHFVVTHQ